MPYLEILPVSEDAGETYTSPTGTRATSLDFVRPFPNPSPSSSNDLFGYAVAGVGSSVLVGAPGNQIDPAYPGAAYLFDGSTGALLTTFLNPSPDGGDGFGFSVASLGPDILVGAPGDDTGATDAGAVYLFEASTGTLLQTFLNPTPDPPPDPLAAEVFGFSVAGVGSNVLVGTPGHEAGSTFAGAAYLFDGSTGALLRTFLDPTPTLYGHFGTSVSHSGSNVLVGAPDTSTDGAAYLFDGSTGALLRTLLNPTPSPTPETDEFGSSIASVGPNVLVGDYLDDTNGPDAGAAYLFDGSTGALLQTFLGNALSRIGFSVAGVGSNVLVGTTQGAAYLFDSSTGALMRTFLSPTAGFIDDSFGFSVAGVGSSVLVGAPTYDLGGEGGESGIAYLFLWDGDANGDGSVTQEDVDLVSSLTGSTVSCEKILTSCHADVDDDFDIDSLDVDAARMAIGITISQDPDADGDSDVDLDDLIIVFLNQFTAACPYPQAHSAHMDVDNDCDIDLDDLIATFLSQFTPWPPESPE
jgi:hypothetical protein